MNDAATKKHILIIDDNAPFRHLLGAFLKKIDCIVDEAVDGLTALDFLAQNKPDLVFVDLQMQPLGGFDFMTEYTGLGYTAPVVLVTGDESSDVLTKSSKLGFSGVLKKPISEDRITQIVRRFTGAA